MTPSPVCKTCGATMVAVDKFYACPEACDSPLIQRSNHDGRLFIEFVASLPKATREKGKNRWSVAGHEGIYKRIYGPVGGNQPGYVIASAPVCGTMNAYRFVATNNRKESKHGLSTEARG